MSRQDDRAACLNFCRYFFSWESIPLRSCIFCSNDSFVISRSSFKSFKGYYGHLFLLPCSIFEVTASILLLRSSIFFVHLNFTISSAASWLFFTLFDYFAYLLKGFLAVSALNPECSISPWEWLRATIALAHCPSNMVSMWLIILFTLSSGRTLIFPFSQHSFSSAKIVCNASSKYDQYTYIASAL